MDMPSRSISHVVSPVARVVPDLRDNAGFGSPVREVVLRTPARVTDTTRHWSDKRHSVGLFDEQRQLRKDTGPPFSTFPVRLGFAPMAKNMRQTGGVDCL